MQANYVQRLRFEFSKKGPARFISHLDLARTLERALNRARMPIAYTQGFNRRPRMQMATALPLGYTSECELADILLTEALSPDVAQTQMMSRMAPGIVIHRVIEVPTNSPSLQSLTLESTYTAAPLDPIDNQELQEKIDQLLAAETLVRERRRGKKAKTYDLRPLIFNLQLNSRNIITMRLCLKPSQTGRPDEVLLALDLDPLAARIHRTQLVLQEC